MGSNAIDLLAVERRVQELTNACGRALMRWGNRRVTPGTYPTVFGGAVALMPEAEAEDPLRLILRRTLRRRFR